MQDRIVLFWGVGYKCYLGDMTHDEPNNGRETDGAQREREPDGDPRDSASFTEAVKRHVTGELGFELVHIARAERLESEGADLERWLGNGYHGSMAWLERDPERRIDPRLILPSAESVIVVAQNYYTPFEHPSDPDHAKISRYAWGRDYHRILPKKLKKLHRYLGTLDPDVENRWYVDTGPPMEKAWAVRAGLGWMGKHTNVISRSHGSWLFLGVMFTSLPLEADTPVADYCGSCTACIDACPTDAIIEPYRLDATRCISYITIEEQPKEPLDPALAGTFDGWVFGCDICQDVCPWNKFRKPATVQDFEPRPGRLDLTYEEILSMSDEEFTERFQGSPVMRAKLQGLKRNAEGVKEARDRSEASRFDSEGTKASRE